MCNSLVQKMTTGQALDDAEKSHLAKCEACMARVVRMLDKSAMSEAHCPDMVPNGTNGDLSYARL